MRRRRSGRDLIGSVTISALAIVIGGCSSDSKPQGGSGSSTVASATGSSPAANSGGSPTAVSNGSGAVAQAAHLVTNPCTIMPTAIIKHDIPNAADPSRGPEPTHCSMSDGNSVVEIVISGGFGEPDPLDPAVTVSDLGKKAWLQEQLVDDAYLLIYLGVDGDGGYQSMSVEYAGHDGKSHKDDAIAIARQIITSLEG